MNRGRFFILIAAVLTLPLFASAQVIITEIMYDPAGADTGREWVVVRNTGTSSVRLVDLRLRTNGSNHKIAALVGDGALASQAHAAIVQDASLFAQDNSSFAGPVFRASFSLTNTSGMVEIVDKSGTVVASKSYQAPPKAPAPPKQRAIKTKQTSPKFASVDETSAPYTLDTATSVESAAATEVAAVATPISDSSPLWLAGAIVLAGAAGIATFYARRIAKREWDIVEEKSDDV